MPIVIGPILSYSFHPGCKKLCNCYVSSFWIWLLGTSEGLWSDACWWSTTRERFKAVWALASRTFHWRARMLQFYRWFPTFQQFSKSFLLIKAKASFSSHLKTKVCFMEKLSLSLFKKKTEGFFSLLTVLWVHFLPLITYDSHPGSHL